MKVDAVVLAGGDGEVIDPTVHIKGLVPVAGKPMVEWVVDALRLRRPSVRLPWSCPPPRTSALGRTKSTSSWSRMTASSTTLLRACDSFRNDRSVLVTTGDLPALYPEAIDDYVTRSLEAGADFSYPLVPRTAMEEQFPGSQRTYVKLVTGR